MDNFKLNDDLKLRLASSVLRELSTAAEGKDKIQMEIFIAFSDVLAQLNKIDGYIEKMREEDLMKLRMKIEDAADFLKKFSQ